jgi:ParB-like chromosome segregation protein Spo0J
MSAKRKYDWDHIDREEARRRQLGHKQEDIAKDFGMRVGMLRTELSRRRKREAPFSIRESAEAYEPHPLAGLFPMMAPPDYEALREDIKTYGQREPIVLHEGQVLEGRNRHKACRELGIPTKVQDFDGGDPLAYVVSLNLVRRHLTTSQRAMIGAELANMRRGERTDLVEYSTKLSLAGAADLVHVSRETVIAAKTVKEHAPSDILEAVKSGTMTVSAAVKQVKHGPTPRQTVPRVEVDALPADQRQTPPTSSKASRQGFQDSLRDLHSRVIAFALAIEEHGGISRVWKNWTQIEKQEVLEQVTEIEGMWTIVARDVQAALPNSSLTLLKGEGSE